MQLSTQALPLIPLSRGVVLPHMVVTLALDDSEVGAAVDAARKGDGSVILVPRSQGRYARIGTVAKVEDFGELPSGVRAVVLKGLHRGVIGTGVAGVGEGIWVQVEPAPEPTTPSERSIELAREYRATVEAIVEARGAAEVREFLRGLSDPGALADTSGYSPDLSYEQKVEVLETVDVEARLEKVLG
ncbi:MAG: LON peptidase substrate-binding domain-containing protein, partial [Actinomycetota bacterium]